MQKLILFGINSAIDNALVFAGKILPKSETTALLKSPKLWAITLFHLADAMLFMVTCV
jgi:hypothetical protein